MRHILPTDLARLSTEICNGPYRSAFPSALPERWIRPIARDLRQVEQTMSDPSDSPTNSMAGPVLMAVHIMAGRLKERQIDTPIMFSVRGFQRWMQVYQFAVEREVVARYTGVTIPGDDDTLLATLDHEIDGLRDAEADPDADAEEGDE
jgi:hypothetical protein